MKTKQISLTIDKWNTIYKEMEASIISLGYTDEDDYETLLWVNKRIEALNALGKKLCKPKTYSTFELTNKLNEN
jgi:hypothetical protein